MQLTILGSGTFIPTAKRNVSGYLLDIGDETILLDGGSGTITQIFKAGRSFLEIRRIFYTHFHLDHTAEFLPILFSRKYSKPQRPNTPITIHAHPGFQKYFDTLINLYSNWVIDELYPADFQPLNQNTYQFPGYTVKIFKSHHTPESYMYRFEEKGVSLLYTGDVDLCEELFKASEKVDFLLIECGNTNENLAPGHMNPNKIKQLIFESRPRKVALTHLPPELEDFDVQRFFEDCNCEVFKVNDLDAYEIK